MSRAMKEITVHISRYHRGVGPGTVSREPFAGVREKTSGLQRSHNLLPSEPYVALIPGSWIACVSVPDEETGFSYLTHFYDVGADHVYEVTLREDERTGDFELSLRCFGTGSVVVKLTKK